MLAQEQPGRRTPFVAGKGLAVLNIGPDRKSERLGLVPGEQNGPDFASPCPSECFDAVYAVDDDHALVDDDRREPVDHFDERHYVVPVHPSLAWGVANR